MPECGGGGVIHRWGDENVDWNGIDDAARFIGRRLLFWRVDVRQYKEKFGTVRVYCSLGFSSWQQFTHPGHMWNRWPRWLDFITYAGPRSPFELARRLLNKVAVPFHIWIYKRTYREAVRRWPHLAKEIIYGADYHELLGGKVKYSQIYYPDLGDPEPTKPDWWDEVKHED